MRPIHDPAGGPLRAVALMSGSGTNIRRILEHGEKIRAEQGSCPFEVAAILSDRWDSKATEIGADFDVPVFTRDLVGWMKKHGVKRGELDKREDFDRANLNFMKHFNAPVAIYGGYMSIASPTLIDAYLGVNVHPADLSVKTPEGKRRWTGAHAVRDAIAAGEKQIFASTHLVTLEVDAGPLLMISPPVKVELPDGFDPSDREMLQEVSDHNQERLKQEGDWVIFPRTIEEIARGHFQIGENGVVHYKGAPVPDGIRL